MEEVSGTPYVSLKRTYMILLIVYVLAAVFGLLAGAALTWHVDPFSECLLFSHSFGGKLFYGHEASKSVLLDLVSNILPRNFQFVRQSPTCTLAVLSEPSSCSTSPSNTGESSCISSTQVTDYWMLDDDVSCRHES